jgi:hypothetical protein
MPPQPWRSTGEREYRQVPSCVTAGARRDKGWFGSLLGCVRPWPRNQSRPSNQFNKGNIVKKTINVSHEELFSAMAHMIALNKRATIAVAGTKKLPPFFYTIGNQEKQLPELLIIGNFKPDDMCGILNVVSDMMIGVGAFGDGEKVELGGEYPLLIYRASKEAKVKYTVQAGQFYNNEDYEVMQVVLPDLKGCYPPDPRCHKDFQVPVLREKKSANDT